MAPCIKFFNGIVICHFSLVLVIAQQVYNKKYNKEDFLKDHCLYSCNFIEQTEIWEYICIWLFKLQAQTLFVEG